MKVSAKKLIKHLVLLVLCLVALQKADEIIERIRFDLLQWHFLVIMVFLANLSLLCQGLVTRLICKFCQQTLGWMTAVQVNVTGALYSVLFPLGAVGYKTWYLKSRMGIPVSEYASHFGLSVVVTLFASSLFFAGVSFGPEVERMHSLLLCLGVVLLWIVMMTLNRMASCLPSGVRQSHFAKPFVEPGYHKKFYALLLLQTIGLLIFMGMYFLGSKALGYHLSFRLCILVVAAQSILMLVNIVPGNFVLLESLVGAIAHQSGHDFFEGVVVSLLIRLITLVLLVVLGLGFHFFCKETMPGKGTSSLD